MSTMHPDVKFRLFHREDGPIISEWATDLDYAFFFRRSLLIPSLDDCVNYPAWSQNIIMMVEDSSGSVIGLVNGYHADFKNKVICAGIILDKKVHKKGFAHNAYLGWANYLIDRYGFRKVVAEIVDPVFVEPLKNVGFFLEGTFKDECFIAGRLVDEYRLAFMRE